MKVFLTTLIFIAIIPATYLAILCFIGLAVFFEDKDFVGLTLVIMGLSGYVGLYVTLMGLEKTKHLLKISLLSSGVISVVGIFIYFDPESFLNELLEINFENLMFQLPLIISLFFIILLTLDYKGINKAKNSILI